MSDEQQQSKPFQIRAAMALLWCSLVIGILISFVDSNPAVKNVPTAFFVTVLVAIFSVMALLIYKLGQGRNWARITFLVLFAIGLIPYVPNLIAMFNSSIIVGTLSAVQLALQLVALYWVFTKPGSLWFKKTAELECSNKILCQPDAINPRHQVSSSVKGVPIIKGIVTPAGLLVLSAFLTIKMSPLVWLLLLVGLVICITVFVKSKARKRLEQNLAESVSNEHLGENLLLRSGLALLMGPMVIVAAALFMILTNNDFLKKPPLAMAGSPPSTTVPFGPNGVPVTVQTLAPNITNIETQGNLESTNDIGCVGPDKLSRKFTPADMYKAAAICAQQAMNKEGAFLVALAGAYGHFDTLRVTDKTAYGAPAMSRMTSFGSLDEKKRIAFQASIKTIFDDPDARAAICNDVIRIGSPDYFPRYMIQHGMGAFTRDTKAGNGLAEGFDASAAWSQTLGSFLHCAGYVTQQPSVTSPPATEQTGGN